jgi:hypothetical protein
MGDTAYRKKEKEEIKPHEITCNQNNQLKYRELESKHVMQDS